MASWQLSGDYFENCNCDVVCPCLVSAAAPLTSRPTQGFCDVGLFFHIDRGRYDQVTLDGLNVAVMAHTPGPMGQGDWSVAAYIDERADDRQTAALGAIFTGAEGGPMAAFAPLIANNLGVKKTPITYTVSGKTRSAAIPGVVNMAVEPLPTMHPSGEIWGGLGHPVAPDRMALAVAGVAPTPITACGGTIPARTGITRRSAGRADPGAWVPVRGACHILRIAGSRISGRSST